MRVTRLALVLQRMPQPAELSAHHRRLTRQKREAITTAATELFVDRGYDGTSLAPVAEATGVWKSTLFKQFPTKATLFEAIIGEILAVRRR